MAELKLDPQHNGNPLNREGLSYGVIRLLLKVVLELVLKFGEAFAETTYRKKVYY